DDEGIAPIGRARSVLSPRLSFEDKFTTDHTDDADERNSIPHPCHPCDPWFKLWRRLQQVPQLREGLVVADLPAVDDHLAEAVRDDELRDYVAEEWRESRQLAGVVVANGWPCDAELGDIGLHVRRRLVAGQIDRRDVLRLRRLVFDHLHQVRRKCLAR